MKYINKTLSLTVALIMLFCAFAITPVTASAETGIVSAVGDYDYELLDDGTVAITAYTGSDAEVTIPSALDGYTVTGVWGAFNENASLRRVIIPESIESVYQSFAACTSLENVTFKDGLKEIGRVSFEGCTSLKSIVIPDSVEFIDWAAFADCTSLSSITLRDSAMRIGSTAFINTAYFNDENNRSNGVFYVGKHLLYADDEFSGECSIKEGTVDIAEGAFSWREGLTGVTIPDSVEFIGEYAFSGCVKLTTVTIPSSVKRIEPDTFNYCSGLVSVTVCDGVESIGYCAFQDCEKLRSITLPDSITRIERNAFENTAYFNNNSNWKDKVLYIGNHIIQGGNSVTDTYSVREGTVSIADYAFYDCINLKEIIISDSVKGIGDYAFASCEKLKSITVPYGVEKIGKYAFGYYYYDYYEETEGEDGFPDVVYKEEFGKYDDFIIYGYEGTEVEKYASDNGVEFVSLEKEPATEPEPTLPSKPETTITLKNKSVKLYVNGTAKISATVKNGSGKTTYTSSDNKVAKVSKNGKVTALKKGKATVTVKNNGVTAKFTVNVKNPKLNVKTKKLKIKGKFQLKIIGKNGKQTYSSNKPKIVSVNKNGKITAKKKGKATITVKTNGNCKLKCKITVR